MVSYNAIFFSSKSLDGRLRAKVENIRAQAHDSAAECFESMTQKQHFARGVHVRSLITTSVPSVPNLYAIHIANNIVKPGTAYDRAGVNIPHDPRQHVPTLLTSKSFSNVRVHLVRPGDKRKPEVPKVAIGSGRTQTVGVLFAKRVQRNTETMEGKWLDRLHAC